MKTTKFTPKDVKKIAELAQIPVTEEEQKKLSEGFNTTLTVVNELFAVNVGGIEPTHQVTGLENVFRKDEIDETRMLSQSQALSNAPRTHNGYFVVEQVIEQES
jgi:aspartyl-tRNA(Asn)/glutamyl-tRNA(Gln) amidotransferase subunit C